MISKNQIKFIQSLHSKKNRDQEQLFIIEGVKLVTEFLLTSHLELHSVYATLDFIDTNKHIIENSSTIINDISEEELAHLREVFAPEVEGKPENLREKILEGKVNNRLAELVLLEQQFIKDPDKKIQDLLDNATQKFGERVEVSKCVYVTVR